MSRLKGKVAIVTGASKGIGAGIARSLAGAGASVVVNYASSREGADRVVAQIKAEGGSVINLSSVTSANPVPNAVIYSATKSAVDSITRSLAKELGPRKIRVNAIAPGGVETEGTHRLGVIGSDFEKQLVAGTPLGRLGQPDDIARLAVYLASDDAGWVTGERITASGGLH